VTPYQARFGHKALPFVRLTDGASHAEIATVLGISRARVAQLECSGLERLRRCLELIEAGVSVDAAVMACRRTSGRPRTSKRKRAK
jgi:hypothetical protein